jgi:protocatechuate 3,4-dioxygenase beta subunit
MNRSSAAAVLWIVWCLLAPAPSSAASSGQRQAPPRDGRQGSPPVATGTATVSGSVTLAASGQPARGARVTISAGEAGGSRATETDGLGRFAFSSLPAGRYTLAATKPGHVSAAYGQTRPGRAGTPIQLADGQRFEARLQIHKGGVLTGTILDEHGEAVPNTQVRAFRYVMQSGQRTLLPVGSASTDDRGIYRVFSLQPGEYVVCATPRNAGPQTDAARRRLDIEALRGRGSGPPPFRQAPTREPMAQAASLDAPPEEEQPTGYAPVYYPGTTSPAQAGTIALAAGEEKQAIDFQLQRVPVALVEGVVVNPTGQPLLNVQVSLVNAGGALPGVGNTSTRAAGDGAFRLSNVAPGQYTLVAQGALTPAGPSPAQTAAQPRAPAARAEPTRLWAMADVSVDGRNVSNVVLTLQPGLTVAGRVVFDGTRPPPANLNRVRVNLSPADPGLGIGRPFATPSAGRVDQNGRFVVAGVLPGRYRLAASNAGEGWFLEEATIDAQDALDFPAEVKAGQNVAGAVVTFTDRHAEISGTVTNERGQPAPDYTIVVYPSDSRYWIPNARRIRTARPATDGGFAFAGLPPGEYRLAPVHDPEQGAWYDPAFLQQLDAGAVRVDVGAGEKKVQSVRISTGGA